MMKDQFANYVVQNFTPKLVTARASFSIKCGGTKLTSASDIEFGDDSGTLHAASFHASSDYQWAVSNTGNFISNPNGSQYIAKTDSQIMETLESELYKTARISPSSLRYYGLGLKNGKYRVDLHFAEIEMDDLQSWKSLGRQLFDVYIQHLDTIGVAPLPKRNSNQALRISSLHQRAWLLKLLAVELHAAYGSSSTHQEACRSILAHLFGHDFIEDQTDHILSHPSILEHTGTRAICKSKVLELLEVVQFRSPDTPMKPSEIISNMKYDFLAEELFENPTTSGEGGTYYYSERGDHLVRPASLRHKLWKKFYAVYPRLSDFGGEADLNDVRKTIQQLLRWAWKYNKNLEEQAAQRHMLTGWSQIFEVSAYR